MLRATRRHAGRFSSVDQTLKPNPGQGAGQIAAFNDITVHPEYDEEGKRPAWRGEVLPRGPEHNHFASMYKWGHNSLTLFKKINEDPGPWWNANSSVLASTWTQLGEIAASGLWSGVWRHTFGLGNYNLAPGEMLARAFGRRDKTGAVAFSGKETITAPTQLLMFPHTKEHDIHKRVRNPPLPAFKQIDGVQGKRVLREVQYHLGQGLRFYVVDGVFGSHPATSTPYRIFTDNATHGYFATMMAIRNRNIISQNEVTLLKREEANPMDEWAWRRPGVVLYHAAGYDFEQPRIVEEFGGPRPQDLGLTSPKFLVVDPYSIPMKAVVGGETRCQTMLESLSFLCARWGYYADDKRMLTLPSDSVLGPNGKLTVVINNTADAHGLRSSKFLFGAHHHRLTAAGVARGWNGNTRPTGPATATAYGDLIESDRGVVHSPLRSRLGNDASLSHRFRKPRRVGDLGYKRPHDYSDAGMARPNLVPLSDVSVVIVTSEEVGGGLAKVGSGDAAGKAFANTMGRDSWLYASVAELAGTWSSYCGEVPCYAVSAKDAKAVIEELAKTGSLNTKGAKDIAKTSSLIA